MTLRDYFSDLFGYRMKNGEGGWEEATQALSRSGKYSITSSPTKFEKLIIDLCKRVEKIENESNL